MCFRHRRRKNAGVARSARRSRGPELRRTTTHGARTARTGSGEHLTSWTTSPTRAPQPSDRPSSGCTPTGLCGQLPAPPADNTCSHVSVYSLRSCGGRRRQLAAGSTLPSDRSGEPRLLQGRLRSLDRVGDEAVPRSLLGGPLLPRAGTAVQVLGVRMGPPTPRPVVTAGLWRHSPGRALPSPPGCFTVSAPRSFSSDSGTSSCWTRLDTSTTGTC